MITFPDTPSYPPSKDVWGNAYWITLHTLASEYPEKPNRVQRKKMKDTIEGILANLPCDECTKNSKKHRKKVKLNYRNRQTLAKSLCELHNIVNEDTGKEVVDCSLIAGSACTDCKIDGSKSIDYFEDADRKPDYSEYKQAIKNIIKRRCVEAGVPEPILVFGACPSDKNNSCTQVDVITEDGKVYINGHEASLRTVEHEIEHWIEFKKGNISKAKDELYINTKARSMVESGFHDENIISNKTPILSGITTMADDDIFDAAMPSIPEKEDKGGVFASLDKFYQPLADLILPGGTSEKKSELQTMLNNANTPQILGYSINAVEDIFLTPLGSAVANAVSGVAAYGAMIMMPELSSRDKAFLANLGSHQFWSLIRYANPNTNKVAHAQAMMAGQAVKDMNMNALIGTLIQQPAPPAAMGMVKRSAGINTPRGINPTQIKQASSQARYYANV